MRETLKVMVSLRPEVAETLKRAARDNRRSAYISGLIMERDRQWREALHFLQSRAWELADLRTATKALAKIPLGHTQDLLAREFEAAGFVQFAECVRKSCDTTLALAVLADEWRLGNEELQRRLGAGAGEA